MTADGENSSSSSLDPSTSAFGDPTPARREVAGVSFALQEAARNLLAKALQAVRDGDEPRARRLTERAFALPYDEHEEVAPAWWSASMLVDDLVIDEMESSEPDDDTWLTACEEVLAAVQGLPADALRGALAVAVTDHELSAAEARRARAAAGGVGSDAWLDRDPGGPREAVETVLGVLRSALAYEAAVARLRAGRG